MIGKPKMRIAAIIGLVTLSVALGISVITFANIDTVLTATKPAGNDTNQATVNATIDQVLGNTWSAFNLATITPIIGGATLVLGAVSWLGRASADF